MTNNTPRGIRNNNPLNIVRGSNWLGLSVEQNDTGFCQFSEMKYGLRAAMYLLKKYITKYNRDTIAKIIAAWAPNSDGNNEDAYAKVVGRHLKKQVNDFVYTIDIPKLTYAMACVECGQRHIQEAGITVELCEKIYKEYL